MSVCDFTASAAALGLVGLLSLVTAPASADVDAQGRKTDYNNPIRTADQGGAHRYHVTVCDNDESFDWRRPEGGFGGPAKVKNSEQDPGGTPRPDDKQRAKGKSLGTDGSVEIWGVLRKDANGRFPEPQDGELTITEPNGTVIVLIVHVIHCNNANRGSRGVATSTTGGDPLNGGCPDDSGGGRLAGAINGLFGSNLQGTCDEDTGHQRMHDTGHKDKGGGD
jgi:hypothetical protein